MQGVVPNLHSHTWGGPGMELMKQDVINTTAASCVSLPYCILLSAQTPPQQKMNFLKIFFP